MVGACAFWGLDNNLTQRISIRDARQIVAVKGLLGGMVSLAVAAGIGGFGHWTSTRVLAACIVGAVSFGLSVVLFVRGLRRLGVLQTGILFSLAPGFAAALCWIFLGDRIAAAELVALGVMTAGALLLVQDGHEHWHTHAPIQHAHEHDHDEHHRHEHDPDEHNRHERDPDEHNRHERDRENLGHESHDHEHRHEAVAHGHGHVHDVHHRHRH